MELLDEKNVVDVGATHRVLKHSLKRLIAKCVTFGNFQDLLSIGEG